MLDTAKLQQKLRINIKTTLNNATYNEQIRIEDKQGRIIKQKCKFFK